MTLHRITVKASKRRRRTRGARSHYIVVQCPLCSGCTWSSYRVRHTYVSLRNWLRRSFAMKQFFSEKTLEKFLAGKGV